MMTAKEYLLTYRDSYREAQAIELKITQVRLKYALPSGIEYSDMPKAHNTERDLSDYMAKVEDLTRRLYKQYTKCVGRDIDIMQRLERMDIELEREVLTLRYTHLTDTGRLMSWEDIADQMHYTVKTVTRIHGRALQHFPMDNVL